MKKYVSIFLCVVLGLLLIPSNSTVYAAENASGYTFTYTVADYGIIITKCKIKSEYNSDPRTVEIPAEIEGIPVVEIGIKAFEGLNSVSYDSIGKVIIPESVKKIGEQAFYQCWDMTEAVIPEGVTYIGEGAFYESGLKGKLTLPESLRHIDKWAFRFTEITEIHLGSNIEYIGDAAFGDCPELEHVNEFPESVTYLGEYLFQSDNKLKSPMTVPYGFREIPRSMFVGCGSLTEINLPDSITKIGDAAFGFCGSLKNIRIPDSVTFIDDSAFISSGLESIVLPENIKEIAEGAFEHCRYLEEVIIPQSVEKIGDKAFFDGYDCSLKKAVILNDDATIGEYAFGYYYSPSGEYTLYEDFTLYGNRGSTAETYAAENGINFIPLDKNPTIKGDINSDGEVNSDDVKLLQDAILGEQELTPQQAEAADMNSDGNINCCDLCALKRLILTQPKLPEISGTAQSETPDSPPAPEQKPPPLQIPAYKPGHILGNDDITIGDALEVLKYIVKMESVITGDSIETGNDAFRAACIVSKEKPSIMDALEILKYLVEMPCELN
jgi:hypothetical protein